MFKCHQCSVLKFCFRSLGNAGLQEASSTPCMSAAKRRQQHRSALCVSYQYVNPSAELRGTQTSAAANGSSSVTSGHPTDISSSQFNNLHLRVDHVKHCHSRLTTCTEFAKFILMLILRAESTQRSGWRRHSGRYPIGTGSGMPPPIHIVQMRRPWQTPCCTPARPADHVHTNEESSDRIYWLRPHANFHEDLQVPTF